MSKRPSIVTAAAGLQGLEGLAALAFGLFSGVETALGEAVDPTSAVAVTVLALGGGLAMLACARMLLRADTRGRAPIVLTQLFALPIAWSLWQSHQPAYAVPLAVVAVLALVLVLSPPVTVWLNTEDDDEQDGEDGEDDDTDADQKAGSGS
ncbi:hypothetical protein [Actinomadura rupiterrae]|uniref:hypothetical protein n=1 Tax=Actinomadura rupiterrae TaxID=559627 RepID=UPI0020A46F37|nr:hypothetical protein [Actinomadura rupiterrae]MCP2340077.1 putative membrane-anchored protein [Actinomadura rupiterrae]